MNRATSRTAMSPKTAQVSQRPADCTGVSRIWISGELGSDALSDCRSVSCARSKRSAGSAIPYSGSRDIDLVQDDLLDHLVVLRDRKGPVTFFADLVFNKSVKGERSAKDVYFAGTL